jgi:hypothetical protein
VAQLNESRAVRVCAITTGVELGPIWEWVRTTGQYIFIFLDFSLFEIHLLIYSTLKNTTIIYRFLKKFE